MNCMFYKNLNTEKIDSLPTLQMCHISRINQQEDYDRKVNL